MSAALETERVTRAMLAARTRRPWTAAEVAFLRKNYHRGLSWLAKRMGRSRGALAWKARASGITRKWTRAELVTLRAEWGELSERGLRRKLRGRTWAAIAIRAHRMGLANPNQGKVDMRTASRITGIDHRALPAVLAAAGVRRTYRIRTNGDCGSVKYRCWMVDADEARAAATAHFARLARLLSRPEAARRMGVGIPTVRAAMQMLAATRPVEGLWAKPWRVSPEDADAAIAMYRASRGES